MGTYATLGDIITPAKVKRCGQGTYPVLSMTMHDGIMLQSERFKKSLASIDQSDYKVVKRGQLVVGFPIDEGVLYVQKAADEGIMSPAYNVWDIDTKKIDSDYLELCLHSPQSMQYYKNKLRGTTARRRSIPTSELLALAIPLPDLPTQRRIASTLDAITALIAKRHQQLDALDQLVKSQFIEMFGDPNTSKDTVSFEVAFQIRDDLRRPINDSVRSGMHENATIPYYGANGQVDTINQYFMDCTAICLAEDCGAYGAGEESSYIVTGKSWVNNHAHVLIPNDCCDINYANAYFRILDMSVYVSGSTRLKLTQSKMKEIPIVLPSLAKQKKFADLVHQSDKSKFIIRQSLQSLETLKKSLMQQYFG